MDLSDPLRCGTYLFLCQICSKSFSLVCMCHLIIYSSVLTRQYFVLVAGKWLITVKNRKFLTFFLPSFILAQKACEHHDHVQLEHMLLLFSFTKGMAYICQGNLWALHLCLVHTTVSNYEKYRWPLITAIIHITHGALHNERKHLLLYPKYLISALISSRTPF